MRSIDSTKFSPHPPQQRHPQPQQPMLGALLLTAALLGATPWPAPQDISVGGRSLQLGSAATPGVVLRCDPACAACGSAALRAALARFEASIKHKVLAGRSAGVSPPSPEAPHLSTASVCVQNASEWLGHGTNESYRLSVSSDGATVEAATIYGAMHGLESLSQLVEPTLGWIVNSPIEIRDAPRFEYRGVLVDTGEPPPRRTHDAPPRSPPDPAAQGGTFCPCRCSGRSSTVWLR